MSRKPARKAKPATYNDVELNRWCIEMAMRWPLIHVPQTYGNSLGAQASFQQYLPERDVDADVIGRANKIKAWVGT